MKKRNSSINEIVLNPLYITNKEFEILKIQGFKVRWMEEDEGSDKDIFTLIVNE